MKKNYILLIFLVGCEFLLISPVYPSVFYSRVEAAENSGVLSSEKIKGKFVVDDIRPDLLGGVFIRITFLDMPDRIFGSWIYSSVNEEKGVVTTVH